MHIERKIGASVAVLASVLLALSAAAPALAGSGPSAGYARPSGVRFAALANVTNTGFAGWVFVAKAAKSVTTEFKVPTLKCTSTTTAVAPLVVFFTGSSSAPNFNAAGIGMECLSGSPAAAPVVIVDGTPTQGTQTLHVGDLIQATVVSSATKTTATVADLTKGHTFKLTKSGKGAATLQEQIEDDTIGSPQLPLANFGKISFSKAAISGKAIGTVKPQAAVNMVSTKKVLQILTGAITGTAKNAFLTTWKHS